MGLDTDKLVFVDVGSMNQRTGRILLKFMPL